MVVKYTVQKLVVNSVFKTDGMGHIHYDLRS